MPEIANTATTAAQSTTGSPKPPVPVVVERKTSTAKLSLIVVLAVAGGVGGAWLVFGRSHPNATAAASGGGYFSPAVVHLEGFTVNLADREDNHFLRVTMDLAIDRLPPGVDKEKPAAGLPMARIRDSILAVLTVGKADVLLTSEGKTELKKNLLAALSRDVPDLGVRDIYFTEFLVQR